MFVNGLLRIHFLGGTCFQIQNTTYQKRNLDVHVKKRKVLKSNLKIKECVCRLIHYIAKRKSSRYEGAWSFRTLYVLCMCEQGF